MQYDIVIIGGGLTGAAAAAALHDYVDSVAIIDAHDINNAAAKIPLRGIALSDGSRRILQNIGVWGTIKRTAYAVKEIRVSRKHTFGTTRIRAKDEDIDSLGYVIRASDLLNGLHQTLLRLNNLTIYSSATVEAAADHGTYMSISIKQNNVRKTIKTRLLILAAGPRNDLSKTLGFSFEHKDYRQTAIVTRIRSESFEQHVAYERFTADGLIAVLPYRPGERIIGRVYVGDGGTRAMQISDADFIAGLQQDLGQRIGNIYEIGERISYPLILRYAKRIVTGRTLLLGDSAQTIHPVGGQGLNLALRDVAFLAEYLCEASDPGASDLLDDYRLRRLGDVRKVMYFTHLLAQLCIGLKQPFAPLLGASLTLLDMMPPIRRLLVRKTLGLSPPWPRLAGGALLSSRYAKI